MLLLLVYYWRLTLGAVPPPSALECTRFAYEKKEQCMNRTEHTRIEPRQSNRTVRSVFINRSIPNRQARGTHIYVMFHAMGPLTFRPTHTYTQTQSYRHSDIHMQALRHVHTCTHTHTHRHAHSHAHTHQDTQQHTYRQISTDHKVEQYYRQYSKVQLSQDSKNRCPHTQRHKNIHTHTHAQTHTIIP